jgi:endonuclease YncB( thermonuclease family)
MSSRLISKLPASRLGTLAAGLALGVLLTLAGQQAIAPATARLQPGVAPSAVTTRTPLSGAYRAQVLKVIDGDTIEARIHVWMGQEVVTRVRLVDIDAPEFASGCAEERLRAGGAQTRLAALVGPGPVVLADIRPDKYFGRVVGRVLLEDGRDASRVLLAEGLARPYRGGPRGGGCADAIR